MKLKCVGKNTLSRKSLANPYGKLSYHDRLVQSQAVDLRNNSKIYDLNNGYIRIEPIERKKKVK